MTDHLIAVEAAIRVANAAERDAAVARSAPIQHATRVEEPGCLVYCFAADPVEADLIQVYELWQDAESLHAHFDHPNYHSMRALLHEIGLAGSVSRKHLITRSAPVYGPDRKATTDFNT